jgi:transposase
MSPHRAMVRVMAKRDARSLDHATLEEMRRLAVKRVIEGGETQVAVARSLEVHPVTVAKWVGTYHRRGEAGLARRIAPGPRPTLTAKQQAQLRRWVIDKTPHQVRFPFALWTLPIIAELIERRFGVVLHKTTVARLLRRLGLSPQRPIRRAFTRDDAACRHWAENEFPAVVRQMQRRQSTLLFEDETGVHEDGPVARTWGARGQTPVVHVTGQRDRVNVISAISPRGRLWFRCYRGTLNAPRFIGFLTALLHDMRGEIDLILDRHPTHVAAATRRFVHEHRARLRLHFLPGYAPDLNPDEHVWTQLKALFRRQPLARDGDLGSAVAAAMTMMQEDRRLVQNFFRHPAVAYVKKALPW